MCLGFALDLWPSDHFELRFFASRIGRSEIESVALSFSYVVNLEMNNSLKWVIFNIVRWQAMLCEGKVRYLIENLTVFFLFLRAVVNIPIQILIISQDDHHTDGA